MEELWSDNILRQIPVISDRNTGERPDSINEHEGFFERLKKTLRDRLKPGGSEKKIKVEDFPSSYIIVPEVEENQSEDLYMEYARRYTGMDMMCTLKEYDIDENGSNSLSDCLDTSLILYSKEAEHVKDYAFPEKTIALSKVPCVTVHRTTTGKNPDPDTVDHMVSWAHERGLRLSSRLFTTVTMLSIKNGEFVTYLSLYIPILSACEEELAG